MNVYEKRPTEERPEKTKKPPTKVKHRNKGDRQHMNVRSRLVAKQITQARRKGCSQQLHNSKRCRCCSQQRSLGQAQGVDVHR